MSDFFNRLSHVVVYCGYKQKQITKLGNQFITWKIKKKTRKRLELMDVDWSITTLNSLFLCVRCTVITGVLVQQLVNKEVGEKMHDTSYEDGTRAKTWKMTWTLPWSKGQHTGLAPTDLK